MTKSPLRWAGSKRSLLPILRQARPETFGTYIEPFVGSACVFFDLAPQSARLSDLNSDLIQFFVELRDQPDQLCQEFAKLDPSGDDYYDSRKRNPSDLTHSERAARFLYLNRFAFNGVYRTNRKGEFNVPRGVRTGQLPSEQDLLEVSELLRGVEIDAVDFRRATGMAESGDFVYLDPPYRNPSRTTYGEYGYGSFGSEDDVRELAKEISRLNEAGAQVLLSFNDDEGLKEVLEDWRVLQISRRRSVSAKVTSRTELRGEILAMNYSPEGSIA